MIDVYFENLPVGHVIELGQHRVTREAIIEFATEFDPQPHHLDDEAANASILKGLSASGWHTCAIMMRMLCDGLVHRAASMGSPGIDELRWFAPVRPGDTLQAEIEVLTVTPSKSKADRGIARLKYSTFNQRRELVSSYVVNHLLRRRG